jgi:hypothetical protein
VCSNHQRVGEPGRPCLPRTQEIGGSNPPALTNSLFVVGMVGRAARQRGANASRPFGSGRFDSCTIHQRGRSSMVEPLPSKQMTRVRFSLPAPTSPRSSSGRGHRSFKSDDAGSNPARGSTMLPLRLAGRAPGSELGGLGSNPRGAASCNLNANARNSSVVERRSHTPRQPQVRSLLPRPVSPA